MRWFRAMLNALRLAQGWKAPTPEIGRDLPSNYAEGEKVFDARVKASFPIGMSVEALLAELRRQGFGLLPEAGLDSVSDATFYRDELVCLTLWSVRWHASGGCVTEIWGVYGCRAP
ncbi:MAG: hypothetical protein JO276_14465 [Sphingomonadaceae bacterium]|nr:hypothetical protein [Sphingomonadaceae bacterium]